jgi:Fur family peroxide stress response transcriptional regulator
MSQPAPQRESAPDAPPAHGTAALRAALEAAGCRYTRQRAAVFEYLSKVHSHPSAEEVYQAVRQDVARISLATVYKALEALVEVGLANKLTYGDDAARYEFREGDHYHLRDVATGEVHDLATPFDPRLLEKLDPTLPDRLAAAGFQVTGYRLEVLGRFEA